MLLLSPNAVFLYEKNAKEWKGAGAVKKIFLLLLCGILLTGSLYCYHRKEAAKTPILVEVETVKQKDIYNSVVAPGTVDTSGIYNVVFADDTLIREVSVSLGQKVRQGDLLMKREAPENRSLIFAKEISTITDQIVSAVAEYGLFLDNRILIPTVLSDEVLVKSPGNGVVSELNVSNNELVEGFSVAAKISDYSEYEITVELSEVYLSSVKVGQNVDITCDALPNKKYKGRVREIANEAKRRGSLVGGQEVYVPIQIALKNADGNLKPGYSVTARICTEKHENTLSLPYQCIVQDQENRELAYVVKDGEIELRRVVTGLELEKETEILYGLECGDKVIKNPLETLKTGQKVTVKE